MKILLVYIICSLCGLGAEAQTGEAILGVWKNGEGTVHIEVFKNKDKYQGKIVWLKAPIDDKTGKPKTDVNHPDPGVRNRPLVGLSNVWGFAYRPDRKEWSGGKIYDPKNGKTYGCTIVLKTHNTLKVRGFIEGMSWLGRTEVWQRVAGFGGT